MAVYVLYDRVGTIVEPAPTKENTTSFRIFYTLYSQADLEDEPRQGERTLKGFADKQAVRDYLDDLRDKQYKTGRPAFNGKFLGTIRGIFSLHELNRITRDDLRPLGQCSAVSFAHACRKGRNMFPGAKEIKAVLA